VCVYFNFPLCFSFPQAFAYSVLHANQDSNNNKTRIIKNNNGSPRGGVCKLGVRYGIRKISFKINDFSKNKEEV
jgi:hypothetical protein